ncbi:MAG: archaeal heat shock protein Hsp20 [Promethearchaeota archaeon]
MPKRDNEDDEEEDEENENFNNPFDFFKMLEGDLFKSKEFQQMFREVYKKISEFLPQNMQNVDPDEVRKWFMKNKSKIFPGSPFVAGFNINFRPDGTPIIDSFGNIRPSGRKQGTTEVDAGVREPLVDINVEPSQIIVIAEMPGVTKEDIELKATTHSLTISTKSGEPGRRYYKEIELPVAINSDYAKARYQNGILEVKLKKIHEKQTDIKVD